MKNKKATKSIIITGGNTGLGFETAKILASNTNDLHIVLAARSQSKGDTAVQNLIEMKHDTNVSFMKLDLASISSIKHFAENFIHADLPPLHGIICNAGAQFVQGIQTTDEGIEATFGVNHLGHFLLVRLLLNQMEEQGRIVVVSSDTHDPTKKTGMPAPRYTNPANLADPVESEKFLNGISNLTKGQIRYTTSKLTNLYFAYELFRKLQKSKHSISILAFNPGMMPGKDSSLARDYSSFLQFMWNNVLPLMRFFRSGIRTTKQSGLDLANIILNDSIASGTYWDGSREISSSGESYNRDRAEELWDWSSEKLGLEKEI